MGIAQRWRVFLGVIKQIEPLSPAVGLINQLDYASSPVDLERRCEGGLWSAARRRSVIGVCSNLVAAEKKNKTKKTTIAITTSGQHRYA